MTALLPVVAAAPTARLLWLACGRTVDADAVHDALADGADARRAVAAAAGQQMLGLLWRALEVADALDTLGEERGRVAALVEVQRLRELLLVPEALRHATAPLVDAGLEPLVVKGPAVARRYPGPGLRPFEDLDVLLPPSQHAAAVAALQGAGWRVRRAPARDRYDTVLVHPAVPDLPLELHYGLEARYDRASALRAEALWAARVPATLFGAPVWVLPTEEELVLLCAHAAKPYHGFDRLIWTADLAMILSDPAVPAEAVDWERVAGLARAARCRTAAAAALALGRRAGARSPAARFPLPARGWRGAALSGLLEEGRPLAPTVPLHLRLALADGPLRRLALLGGTTHGYPLRARATWYLRNSGWARRRWRLLHEP